MGENELDEFIEAIGADEGVNSGGLRELEDGLEGFSRVLYLMEGGCILVRTVCSRCMLLFDGDWLCRHGRGKAMRTSPPIISEEET